MLRIICMASGLYARKIQILDEEELDDIKAFVESGDSVLLCEDMESALEVLNRPYGYSGSMPQPIVEDDIKF